MRNIVFNIILIISISTLSLAEITVTKVASKAEEVKDYSTYKGNKNFLGENAHKYIGETLYLKGIDKILREHGYENFYSDYKNNITYKTMYSYGNYSKYKELAEKEYKVLDVIKGVKADYSDFEKSIYGTLYILKLRNKTNNDIVYYKYGADSEVSFPFIVVKFYETQKKLLIGKKFILQDSYFDEKTDYLTGKPITVITGQVWKCLDVTIDDEWYDFSLILKNKLGEQILLRYALTLGEYVGLYTLDEAKLYRKKFGKINFDTILKKKISLGMTKEEVLRSWDKPKSINEDIFKGHTREQWIYNNQYIYFENNKLTYIQNH